jgi:hypothetical protein
VPVVDEDDYLAHYGILRRSGRYPWGSGGNVATPRERSKKFLDIVADLKNQGLSDDEIAKGFGMNSREFRQTRTIALAQNKQAQVDQALKLADTGMSNAAIAREMGLPNESSVRALRAPGAADKAKQLDSIAAMLERQVQEKTIIDVGVGTELSVPLGDSVATEVGVPKDRFQTAVAMLKDKGYETHEVPIPQLGTGKLTNTKVLCPPGMTQREAWERRHEIKLISEKSEDRGRSFPDELATKPPTSVNPGRIQIRYAEDGGAKSDGVIYLRPGADGLDMGSSRYAQVRIGVDDTHYLKGMAVYRDDLPKGVDIMFNTNKSRGTPMLVKGDDEASQVLKPMAKKPDGTIDTKNPFTASIKPGGQRGHLNIVNEEGDWEDWTKSLPSQMLSKQNPTLVKQQLDRTYEDRLKEFRELSSLTNPVVKRDLLEKFADGTDAASVHLQAAAMPKQATKVILPIESIKEHEIYAPSFENGTRVALIRFPHGGTFEIPELTVNNKNREAKKIFGDDKGGALDAVGIHHRTAEKLSGADFDGDHVLVIPNQRGQIKSSPSLKALEGFDPKRSYPKYPGMDPIDRVKGRDQTEMGKISNLITDMTIQGAPQHEIASAVRHSMVVIDAKKHELDYKQSYIDNGIPALKEKYQGGKAKGAATLLSRSTSQAHPFEKKLRKASEGGPIDPETGKLVFVETGRRNPKTGELIKMRSTKGAEAEDAHTLVSRSGTQVEHLYADHSNRLKALANAARKEQVATKNIPYNSSAKKVYANEVASLDAKLNTALKNAPLERQAQVVGNAIYKQRLATRPDMEKEEKRKVRNQALGEARARTGANKARITPTQAEWDAIQAGAISTNQLEKILRNANVDEIRKLATPRSQPKMDASTTARAKGMLARGYTQAEVAAHLGISLTTLKEGLK